jgi:hypothetical protein
MKSVEAMREFRDESNRLLKYAVDTDMERYLEATVVVLSWVLED